MTEVKLFPNSGKSSRQEKRRRNDVISWGAICTMAHDPQSRLFHDFLKISKMFCDFQGYTTQVNLMLLTMVGPQKMCTTMPPVFH